MLQERVLKAETDPMLMDEFLERWLSFPMRSQSTQGKPLIGTLCMSIIPNASFRSPV